MSILVDVDGVLADTVGALGLQEEEVTDFDFFKCLPHEKAQQVLEKMKRSGFAYGIDPYPGAIEFLKALGDKAVLVTAPFAPSLSWTYFREAWIRDVLGFKGPVVHTSRKDLVRGEVLIDDKLENCESFPNGAILFDRPWNKKASFPNRDRVRSYEQCLQRLKDCQVL